jgi:pilus assembly protein CpaC
MNLRKTFSVFACTAAVAVFGFSIPAQAYQLDSQFEVTGSVDSIEIITGSSRRLKFGYNVPELMVENPDVIQATPVAPDEVLISGLKPGISTVTISDANKRLQTIMITVTVDVRELNQALSKHFPDSNIEVDALKTGVIVSGFVARADQVENVMMVARDFFPTNVINQLQVQGTQNIAIKVKVYEVSRSKLRALGVDWSYFGKNGGIVSSVSGLISAFSIAEPNVTGGGANITAGVIGSDAAFRVFIEALETRNVAKLLDEPVLIAQNGRPAEFLSGGEVPIQVASGLGTNSIEFRPFGTKLDMVPIVLGQGQLTLEVRAEVSEIAPDLSGATGVPGFRVRRVNTGVKMKAGHTLALAGDYRQDSQASARGIPKLMDAPFLGTMFRRVEEETNETELVFLITPRFISEVEPYQVPALGPGQLTGSPSDRELFLNSYLEVPRCKDDCPVYDRMDEAPITPNQSMFPLNSDGRLSRPNDQFPRATSAETSRRESSNSVKSASQSNGFHWPTGTSKR